MRFEVVAAQKTIEWPTFLVEVPPPTTRHVTGVLGDKSAGLGGRTQWPQLLLHCPDQMCSGPRVFEMDEQGDGFLSAETRSETFVKYRCRNCGRQMKTYALMMQIVDESKWIVIVTKLGEYPFFGPPIAPGLRKLLGTDMGLYVKGRRSENMGLGIGAFTYYRRVVNNQKNKLLDEILKVARATDSHSDAITTLEQARDERDFARSVELMKDAIPGDLRYHGQNPLALINSVLGHSIHEAEDEECLQLAGKVRVMLEFIAERIQQALTSTSSLDDALASLQRKHEERKNRSRTTESP